MTQDMKLSEDEEEIEVPPIDSVLGLTTMLEEKETLVQQLTGQLEENRKLLETTQQSTESSLIDGCEGRTSEYNRFIEGGTADRNGSKQTTPTREGIGRS